VLLLGYGLVALPRSLWNRSSTSLQLKQIYFKIAKVHGEKCEVEETLEDILNEIKAIAEKIKYNNPLRHCVDIIVKKVNVGSLSLPLRKHKAFEMKVYLNIKIK
jgi:hypothetical protein